MKHLLTLFMAFWVISGCARVASIGQPPKLAEQRNSAEFEAMINPELDLSLASQPAAQRASLWQGPHRSIVGDRRAVTRGDILTVVIEIDDRAEMSNTSGRSRNASDKMGISQLAGLPQRMASSLPKGATVDPLVEGKSASTFKGTGSVSRREKLTLRVAATVLDRLPNGVLHIQGTQQVRVNFEMRDLTVSGFVRPLDIDRNNEIRYDRIAGARISYGGEGQISDVQQPRYGQQVADIILPY